MGFLLKHFKGHAGGKVSCNVAQKGSYNHQRDNAFYKQPHYFAREGPVDFSDGHFGTSAGSFILDVPYKSHKGLMYPCKHLYLNALPLASIKKPRDWHV